MEYAGVISAGFAQTRFNCNAKMRFQDALQTESSQPTNANNLPENAHHMGLSISHQDSVRQQHQASINNQQQYLFGTTFCCSGNLTSGVNRSRSFSAQARNMIANQGITTFGGNNVLNSEQSSATDNPNVSKGDFGGCKYVFIVLFDGTYSNCIVFCILHCQFGCLSKGSL